MQASGALVALSFLVVALAGCAQGGDDATAATSSSAPTQGDLRGVVVDSAIKPIANAFVQLSGNGLVRTGNTSSGGEFKFPAVPVGSYFIEAKKAGFIGIKSTVEINGTDAVQRFTLSPDPIYRAPVAQPYKHTGFLQCGAAVAAPPVTGYASIALCNEVNTATGLGASSDTSFAVHSLDPGEPTFVQTELDWTSSQQASHSLLLYDDAFLRGGGDKDYVELASSHGASPVVNKILEGRTGKLGLGSDLRIRVFPYFDDPLPAGAVYEQDFETVSHVFYGFKPPEGWIFSKDGAPKAPPA